MANYTISLYQPVLKGSNFIAYITDQVFDWKRSIRLQGGFWLGSFTYVDQPSVCEDFFRTCLGYHLAEHTIGTDPTWEGMIADMVFDPMPNSEGMATVEVDVIGYVHTCQWRYSTVSGSTDYASVYLSSLISTDCEFLQAGRIDENTITVELTNKIDQRVWDVLQDIIQKGDASGNPWRFYVGPYRKTHYHLIDVTPLYFIRGGVKRRRSLLDMENAIVGQYEDTSDTTHDLTTITNDESIAAYGRREGDLITANVSEGIAEQMQALQLAENAWPWPRAESVESATLFESDSAIVPLNPYLITPGVVRDTKYPIGGQEHGSCLEDLRDFFIEEVEVSDDGVTLRSWSYGLESFIPSDILNKNKSKKNSRKARLLAIAAKRGMNFHALHGTPESGAWASQSNMNKWFDIHKQRRLDQ
jgi:hypothetical protein